MRAFVAGGVASVAVLAESWHIGVTINSLTVLLALAVGSGAFILVRGLCRPVRRGSATMDRLLQADRDERIIRVANAAQVRL